MRFGVRGAVVFALAVCASMFGCGSDDPAAAVLRVPADHATIQAAVTRAAPGDLVLVAAGTYAEDVTVVTPGITIRGVDRNTVVLDGGHQLTTGISVTADGVAIENLTVRNYLENGVFFDGAGGDRQPESGVYGSGDGALVGYRVAYVTASNNGRSGVHAFASRDGLIEHVYASGHPDSGVYIGQCSPCNTVVTDSVAENNAIGYSGANASGSVFVVHSVFRGNRLGMTPSSHAVEQVAPQAETVVAGNLVVDNANAAAPATAQGFFGGGITIGGGTQNTILRNRVSGHPLYGVALVSVDEFDPIGNRVEGNVLGGNGVDLYYELRPGDVATFDNCFTGNEFALSMPADIEVLLPCDAPAGPVTPSTLTQPAPPPTVDYRTIPVPGPQATMPGDVASPPSDPAGGPDFPDLDDIGVPPTP